MLGRKWRNQSVLGGLGFKDINQFNDALLAKLSWRLLTAPNCLLARILTGKYCKSSSFLECTTPATASHGWRSILIGRDILKTQLGWSIGNGTAINIWKEAWLSHTCQTRPMGPSPEAFQDLKVCNLLNETSMEWDMEKIDFILPVYKDSILLLKPRLFRAPDKLIWLKHPSGSYTTKSGYFAAAEAYEAGHLRPNYPITAPITNWITQV